MKLIPSVFHSGLMTLLTLGLAATCLAAPVRIDPPVPFPNEPDPQAEADGARLPKLVKSVDPVLPPEAAALKRDQRVYVSFVVDARGKVLNVSPMFDPPAALASAAAVAVRQWEFEPGLHYFTGSKQMVPVYTQMTVLITFSATDTAAP